MKSTPSRTAIAISVLAAFFASGGLNAGHAVGDRLDAGQRDRAAGERRAGGGPALSVSVPSGDGLRLARHRDDRPLDDVRDADRDDQQGQARRTGTSGSAKMFPDSRRPRRLPTVIRAITPTPTGSRHRSRPGRSRSARSIADEVEHGDRHHVVDEQRAGGDEAEQRRELLARDGVGAAAARERVARPGGSEIATTASRTEIAIATGIDRSSAGRRRAPGPAGSPRSRRRRRDRVGAEDRQRLLLRQPLVDVLVVRERPADQPRLDPGDGAFAAGPRAGRRGLGDQLAGPGVPEVRGCGRSTRTRRSASLRPLMGRRPPIMGWAGRPHAAGGLRRVAVILLAPTIRDVGDHGVLAAHQRLLQAPRSGCRGAVPPVPRDVLGQHDDGGRGGRSGGHARSRTSR